MKLNILTPEKTVFEGEIDSLVVPGARGLFGILQNHAPILSQITPGQLHFKQGENTSYFHISGGLIEFVSNQATILADAIEEPKSIDITRVDKSISRARKRLKNRKDIDVQRAERALARALARRKVYTNFQ